MMEPDLHDAIESAIHALDNAQSWIQDEDLRWTAEKVTELQAARDNLQKALDADDAVAEDR